ncbi:ergothioneine biosynthesis protein EgtB [Dyadobacter jejuensis]|uniref:Ergothioneine biosynthesis protein EgtB n=1 Tax=Dyadobacter jejuensis TaxID=1082580 RepID=A0A316AMW2_9BACT|nr:ergothioneine biosynthesis protein EgtB [Dyadobacter jejuensis]PWJ58798.1 ergothioneine biosynthesis protein EgtB [Dyadobacter jejuensis]
MEIKNYEQELLSVDPIEYFYKVRNRSIEICKPLQVEDYIPQPVPFISPAKWHLAHTSWFFETFILKPYLQGYCAFHEDFGFLFNSYYNNVGKRLFRANRGNITRPGVVEVYDYRAHVDQGIRQLLLHSTAPAVLNLLELGLQHEQQHQELMLTDIKYTLGHNPTFPVYDPAAQFHPREDGKPGYLSLEEGLYEIGHQGNGFCFDNELGKHKVYLPSFQIANQLVTNGEYLSFMEAGGYSDFNLWLDEGWSWLNENKVEAPLYWHKMEGKWFHYTLAGLKEVDPNTVLTHINYYEASAFAQWAGKRLPTEFEWEVASKHLEWGKRWEWTNSAYLAYPGFEKAPGAVGEYNGKFMVNQMVLRGASSATSEGHSRATYRNFFHAHHRWQFTGLRLAQ